MNTSPPTRFFPRILTKRQLLTLCLTAIVASVIWYAQPQLSALLATTDSNSDIAQPVKPKPMPVNVATVQTIDTYKESRRFTGTIRARNTADLAFEGGGRLIEVLVDEGDSVEADQVLAILDTETLAARRSAAVATLSQAESILAELQAGPRTESIDSARASAAAAKSEYQRSEINLKRLTQLRASGAISAEEYDQAVFTKKTSKANFDSARQKLAELVTGTRSEKITAQESAVNMSKATVKEIDVMLEQCKIVAPFAGKVTRCYLDHGTIAAASSPVIRIVEQSHLEAWVGLPISVASKISVGDVATIVVDNQPHKAILKAKISELDAATRTQTVMFSLDESASKNVIAGQLCEASFENEVEGTGYWVPHSSLAKGIRGLWSVMVVMEKDNGDARTEKRDVEVVRTSDERVLVRGMINPGDVIVVDGIHRITDGQLVIANSNAGSRVADKPSDTK